MSLLCMWQGPNKDEECNKEATILLIAECSTGCWTGKRVFACEPHSVEAKLKCKTNPDYGCGRCDSPVEVTRMTSV